MIRSIKALAALAIAGASVLGVASQASADPNPNNTGSSPQWIQLDTSNHAGIYNSPYGGTSSSYLSSGDYVWADCWVAGNSVGNAGDVWYHTTYVYQYGQVTGVGESWTFAPFVDYAAAFHAVPGVPHC